jgi:hypothetical protein
MLCTLYTSLWILDHKKKCTGIVRSGMYHSTVNTVEILYINLGQRS